MRGKDRRRAGPLRAPGITPACAGKSHIATVLRETFKDHPRLCGEKNDILVAPPTHLGSPPRVRGKDDPTHGLCLALRITPACAGKRFSSGCCNDLKKDHPRVCGEKSSSSGGLTNEHGSPPRVRGKEPFLPLPRPIMRITPACAGKSGPSITRKPSYWDHPRVCGEKTKKIPEFRHFAIPCYSVSLSLRYS